MNFKRYFFSIFFLICWSVSAQKSIKHKVVSGESIYSIARKYNISEDDIYQLNPKTKGAILSIGTVLNLPKNAKAITTSSKKSTGTSKTHQVKSGESFYAIALKYDLSLAQLKAFNPGISPKNLQIGTVLQVVKPKKSEPSIEKVTANKDRDGNAYHEVKKGETLSTIATLYRLKLSTLKQLNPGVSTQIQIGQKLIISKAIETPITKPLAQTDIDEVEPVSPVENEAPSEDEAIEEDDDSGNIYHVVTKGETLSKVSRQYGISLTEIKRLNPRLGNRLKIGHKLLIKQVTTSDAVIPIVKEATHEDVLEDVPPLSETALQKADYLIERASRHLGTRYRSGGTAAGGFDCSGLMIYTFKEMDDISLPRTSSAQSGYGKKIKRKNAQKGDLIFFTTNGRGTINHVGMITEVLDDEIKFIHSSVRRGVIISSTTEPYYARRFVKITRVLQD